MWGVPAFVFFFAFLHRVAPGAVVKEIMQAFNASAEIVGLLSPERSDDRHDPESRALQRGQHALNAIGIAGVGRVGAHMREAHDDWSRQRPGMNRFRGERDST